MSDERGILTGELIRLAPLELEDLDRLIATRNDEETLAIGRLDGGRLWSRHDAEAWLRDGAGSALVRFGVRRLADDLLAGTAELSGHEPVHRSARLGIGLHPDSRGGGLGTDAVRTLVRFGFDQLNLRRIWLGVQDDHEVAIRAYEKAGFVTEGKLRDEVWRDGAWRDLRIMSVLQHEWRP